MALLLQLVGSGAADDQEHTLRQPSSESLASDTRVILISLITILAIAFAACLTYPDHPGVAGFRSLLSTLGGWFLSWFRARENEASPLGEEAESEPESMSNLVDLDLSDANDAGSGDLHAYHSPRSVEEILGVTPPSSHDSDPSEQPQMRSQVMLMMLVQPMRQTPQMPLQEVSSQSPLVTQCGLIKLCHCSCVEMHVCTLPQPQAAGITLPVIVKLCCQHGWCSRSPSTT